MFRCKIEDGEASPTSHFCGRPQHVKLPVSVQAAGMTSSNGRHDHGLNSDANEKDTGNESKESELIRAFGRHKKVNVNLS